MDDGEYQPSLTRPFKAISPAISKLTNLSIENQISQLALSVVFWGITLYTGGPQRSSEKNQPPKRSLDKNCEKKARAMEGGM